MNMNPQLKKRLFDLLWAAFAAGATAFLSTLIPGVKELLGDQLTASLAPYAAALAITLRSV